MTAGTDAPAGVLVVGATGSVGRRVVAAAARHGLRVRALARDVRRAREALSGAEVVAGDLEQPDSLGPALDGVDAVIFTHGGRGGAEAARRIDYGGVATVLRALGGRRVRIVLMTSIGVTGSDRGAYRALLDWKRRSERLVRASGHSYTVVRPSWFDRTRPGDDRLVLEQGDTGDGGIGRDQLAEVLVRSVLTPGAAGKTFELYAAPGAAPRDWDGLFSALAADAPGDLDAVKDPHNLPLDAEPPDVRQDIELVTPDLRTEE